MLDDLIAVIETIQNRIREHGHSLRENETRTRMALIDPLLTVLGWNVADPEVVEAEDMGKNHVEYYLFGADGDVIVGIAPRKLGGDLELDRVSLLNSFEESNDLYYCLTDGDHWELYDAIRPSTAHVNRIMELDITKMSAVQCANQLLQLAKSDLGWIVLSRLNDPTKTSPPSAIRFPDGSQREIKAWYHVLEHTSQWLWTNKLLTSSNVPVQSGYKLHIVSLTSQHKNGSSFSTPVPVEGTPLFLESKVSSKAAISYTRKLLAHCGQDPATVLLKLN